MYWVYWFLVILVLKRRLQQSRCCDLNVVGVKSETRYTKRQQVLERGLKLNNNRPFLLYIPTLITYDNIPLSVQDAEAAYGPWPIYRSRNRQLPIGPHIIIFLLPHSAPLSQRKFIVASRICKPATNSDSPHALRPVLVTKHQGEIQRPQEQKLLLLFLVSFARTLRQVFLPRSHRRTVNLPLHRRRSSPATRVKMPTVHLLDYVAGNIRSLVNAIEKLGYDVEWIKSPEDVPKAEVCRRLRLPPSNRL